MSSPPAPLSMNAAPRPRREPEKPRPLTRKTRLLSLLITVLTRAICATLRLRVENEARAREAIQGHAGVILVTWHGRTLIPLDAFRHRGYWVLISLSRDGDVIAHSFRRNGFRVIRGSTGRRGAAATREALAALKGGGHLVLSPDGPRGPNQKAQAGAVYLAQRSGCPILPGGFSAAPRWLLNSWDRHMIPRPFGRAAMIYGQPLFVGPDDDLEEAARRVESAINALQADAERLVRAFP